MLSAIEILIERTKTHPEEFANGYTGDFGKWDDVIKEFNKMNTIIENPFTNGNIINRYDDTIYVKYTHCELHPSMMLGVITSIIPFCNHN